MIIPSKSELLTAVHWIIHSPNLLVLDSTWNFPNDFYAGIVQEKLDAELDDVILWMTESKVRLGRLFERLVFIIFDCHAKYEVLETNVGIFNDERQLTELDLIVRQPNGVVLHLETSVKFYLYQLVNGVYTICGSDGSDVIDERLEKFQRQILHGQKYLKSQYTEDLCESGILTKGRLFEERFGTSCKENIISTFAERGEWTYDPPSGDENYMEARWQWICWPPKQIRQFVPSQAEIHTWKEGPIHVLHRRKEEV